jgi:benzoate membrane transport protein
MSLIAKLSTAIADFDRHAVVNGLLACLFAITAPLSILLASARQGGLETSLVSSWIFAAYGFGGALTLVLASWYRQPLGMGWSIPAAALIGPAFVQFGMSDIVGVYLATALLLLALGLTRSVSLLMKAIPLPVMMAMTAGVFLPFGAYVLRGLVDMPVTTTAMSLAFLATPRFPIVGRWLPPVLSALAAGLAARLFEGPSAAPTSFVLALAHPVFIAPTFSWPAMVALVLPLTVTVVGIHNPQGFAVLRQSGHAPPVDIVTDSCGLVSIAIAFLGCGPACLTGPANAIIVSSGEPRRHYAAAIVFGIAMLVFGFLAPFAGGACRICPGRVHRRPGRSRIAACAERHVRRRLLRRTIYFRCACIFRHGDQRYRVLPCRWRLLGTRFRHRGKPRFRARGFSPT